jgi:hypothetical protein
MVPFTYTSPCPIVVGRCHRRSFSIFFFEIYFMTTKDYVEASLSVFSFRLRLVEQYSFFWVTFLSFDLSLLASFFSLSNRFTNVLILSKQLLRLLDLVPHKSTCSAQIPQMSQPYVHLWIQPLPHCGCQSQC